MATQPMTYEPEALVTLGRRHRAALRRFLERDVALNLFALSWLENHGVTPRRKGTFHFRGILDEDEALRACALVITDRLVLLDAEDARLARYLGRWYSEAAFHFQHIVSARHNVDPFWEAYVQASFHNGVRPHAARLVSPQRMLAISRRRWLAEVEPRHAARAATGLRPSRSRDLDAVFLASARMHREETLEDPLEHTPDVFRQHVRHRIDSGRSFVWFDDHRRLLFKADVSAQSRYGVQISGVYTPPQFRGQGIATRAMVDLCRAMFARGWPRVTLYVNDQNAAARRVYERVGFEFHGDYATIFVAK